MVNFRVFVYGMIFFLNGIVYDFTGCDEVNPVVETNCFSVRCLCLVAILI